MPVNVNNGGIWTPSKKIWARGVNAWNEVVKVWVNDGGVWKLAYQNVVAITISSNVANFNLAATLGNPTTPVTATVTVKAGAFVISSNINLPAFTTGDLPAGSVVTLIVEAGAGVIGRGGRGSTSYRTDTGPTPVGGGAAGYPAYSTTNLGAQNGGTAISAKCAMTIHNSGTIGGGGGGSVAGGLTECSNSGSNYQVSWQVKTNPLTEFTGAAAWYGAAFKFFNGSPENSPTASAAFENYLRFQSNTTLVFTKDATNPWADPSEKWIIEGGCGAGGSDSFPVSGQYSCTDRTADKDGVYGAPYSIVLRVFGTPSTILAPTPEFILTKAAIDSHPLKPADATLLFPPLFGPTNLSANNNRPGVSLYGYSIGQAPAGGALGQDGICIIDTGAMSKHNDKSVAPIWQARRTIPAGRAGAAIEKNGNVVTVATGTVLGPIKA